MYSQQSKNPQIEPKKIFLYTDIGRDVDDALGFAILYSQGKNRKIDLKGIVTNSMISERRAKIANALLNIQGSKQVNIAIGSDYALGKESEIAIKEKYLAEHILDGKSYEGLGLNIDFDQKNDFNDPIKLLFDELQKAEAFGYKVDLMVRSPMTDLAKATLDNMDLIKRNVSSITIQGNGLIINNELRPDKVAYNISEDYMAADLAMRYLGDSIPFRFVGKFAAYQAPLMLADFQNIANKGGFVGKFLFEHAKNGLLCFFDRNPELCCKLYCGGKQVTREEFFNYATDLSKPYDPVSLLALTDPELFVSEKVQLFENGPVHEFIGMNKENPGVKNSALLKSTLISHILNGCK